MPQMIADKKDQAGNSSAVQLKGSAEFKTVF